MMLRKPLLGPETDLDCVSTGDKGYRLQESDGEPWWAGLPATWTPFIWKDSTADFTIAESPDDLLGPVSLSVIVKRLTRSGVALSAEATKDGKTVVFWTGTATFGADGKAILPCWTKRLVLNVRNAPSAAEKTGGKHRHARRQARKQYPSTRSFAPPRLTPPSTSHIIAI